MKYNRLIPELTVTNIERSKEFYTELLGFEIAYERPEDKFIFRVFYSSFFSSEHK